MRTSPLSESTWNRYQPIDHMNVTAKPRPSRSCGRWAGTGSTSTPRAATYAWSSAATTSSPTCVPMPACAPTARSSSPRRRSAAPPRRARSPNRSLRLSPPPRRQLMLRPGRSMSCLRGGGLRRRLRFGLRARRGGAADLRRGELDRAVGAHAGIGTQVGELVVAALDHAYVAALGVDVEPVPAHRPHERDGQTTAVTFMWSMGWYRFHVDSESGDVRMVERGYDELTDLRPNAGVRADGTVQLAAAQISRAAAARPQPESQPAPESAAAETALGPAEPESPSVAAQKPPEILSKSLLGQRSDDEAASWEKTQSRDFDWDR